MPRIVLCCAAGMSTSMLVNKMKAEAQQRALALEANAMPNLKTIKGLGRNYSWQERFGKE